jgi:SAM-dependent methyltransferase
VQDLKLHRVPPQRILDLGCGGGFFLFILKRFKHSVLGLDIDESSLFRELIDVFGVPRTIFRIEAFQKLPKFDHQFDWITAFSIGFDRDRMKISRWGLREWDFLLHDLQSRLAPGGNIYLTVNPLPDGRTYLTHELREFFLSRGARIERERIFFRRGVKS